MKTQKKIVSKESSKKPVQKKRPLTAPKKAVAKTKAAPKKTTAIAKKKSSPKKDSSEVENLKRQLNETTQEYGELLACFANLKIQKERMLGKILLGLHAIGIGPDEIFAMCGKMFQKAEPQQS